jgi:hypothetical protein
MDDTVLCNILEAILSFQSRPNKDPKNDLDEKIKSGEEDKDSVQRVSNYQQYPLSPASEAFAEILICEIALKNRDRLGLLWHNHLSRHYCNRLDTLSKNVAESQSELIFKMSGSVEKSITGLLRISCFSMKRGKVANDVLFTWSLLDSCLDEPKKLCILDVLDRHFGEGIWRITRCIDDSCMLSEKGWHGILSLIRWCVHRGSSLPPISSSQIGQPIGLADDDPSIQAYRSLHYLLNVSEVKNKTPFAIGESINELVITGDRRNCPKLSIAGLDLLQVLTTLVGDASIIHENESQLTKESRDLFWKKNWLPVIESVANASRLSNNPVRFW